MLIDEYKEYLGLKRMCELLGVNRGTYYNFKKKTFLKKAYLKDKDILKQIKAIILKFPGYGYRRITAELRRRGETINHKKALRIMKENNLTKKKRRSFISTTNSYHNLFTYPNIIKGFFPKRINQLWVADITYIHLRYEFVYLSCILDVFSRKVVGWSLKNNLSNELAISSLKMALSKRDIKSGLIHHSDRGIQYASKKYTYLLERNNILISMSATGNPYENAFAESFIATLKKEEVHLVEYENMKEALKRIGYFIEDVYNSKRLHSSLGNLPPDEFESKLKKVCVP